MNPGCSTDHMVKVESGSMSQVGAMRSGTGFASMMIICVRNVI